MQKKMKNRNQYNRTQNNAEQQQSTVCHITVSTVATVNYN